MPRIVNHDERRRDIALSVWHLIATRGMEAVTFRAVAEDAGISVGRIQHYFADKNEMIRHSCRTMVDMAGDVFSGETRDADPLATFHLLVAHVIPSDTGFRIGTYAWYAYLAKSLDDPEIEAIMREATHGAQLLAAELLWSAQRQGDIDSSLDATGVALRALAMADGLAMRVLIGELRADEAIEVVRRAVNEALTAP